MATTAKRKARTDNISKKSAERQTRIDGHRPTRAGNMRVGTNIEHRAARGPVGDKVKAFFSRLAALEERMGHDLL